MFLLYGQVSTALRLFSIIYVFIFVHKEASFTSFYLRRLQVEWTQIKPIPVYSSI